MSQLLPVIPILLCLHQILSPTSANCDEQWSDHVNYDVIADRVYYIACTEIEWDYAPSGKNLLTGQSIGSGDPADTWLYGNEADLIGSKYLKGLYREYTDNCFDHRKDRSERDEHLGSLGPNIRALEGEIIKIYYKNFCSFPNSMHAHGLKYNKLSEGAPYFDGSNDGDIVQTNGQWIYIWQARYIQSDELSSEMWLYHSHVDEVRDVYTGLFGAILITKQEMAIDEENNLMPEDIDREFVTYFTLNDENESWLFEENLERYLTKHTPTKELLEDPDFIESNLMHAINGYLFGNLDDLISEHGEHVRWYTASFGNEGDGPHSPHWHGNIGEMSFGVGEENTDTVVLIPGTTAIVTMHMDNVGKWLYHCHVHDHIEAGMVTTYTVDESSNSGIYCCRSKYNQRGCGGYNNKDECELKRTDIECVWDTSNCEYIHQP